MDTILRIIKRTLAKLDNTGLKNAIILTTVVGKIEIAAIDIKKKDRVYLLG
ncbi:MAG: hypothetical protein M1580_00135 [Candidatus Parvarchaeota archaeon]|nr:hypothetical protein [Candidatus Parvarchaeota archaeon]